jgi:hypothetical protein
MVTIFEGRHRKAQRNPPVDLFGLVIEDRGALLDRAEPGGGTSDEEERFCKCGLAAPAVTDEGDVTDSLR